MIGETVSHYRIRRKLGGGAMGVVYEAEDIKLKRSVALKFLPPQLTGDPEAKTRFTREAQAASALDHPNICTIHEIDETPDGQMFICMAHYEGETLKKKIARGPVSFEEAIRITTEVAQGLEKAHDAGIVHRDIKPANLMMTSDGLVKIVDFGVSKLLGSRDTKTGLTLGTLAYMSPEQVNGEDIDARSDIFSLGVVLYELLTGQVRFASEPDPAVLYKIINEEPEPVTTYRPDIPEELQRILEKMLKKTVYQRYQSALELRTDLENLAQGLLLGRSEPVRRPSQGSRLRIGLAAAVIVAGVLGWTFLRDRGGPPPIVERALAVVDFLDLASPDDIALSAGMTGLVHVGLVESSPCRVVSPVYLHDLRRRLFGSARGPIGPDQALEVAREAGATMLLTGQMTTSGDNRYVTWQLVQTKDGESVGAKRIAGGDLPNLADGIITGVLPLLAQQCDVEIPSPPPSVTTMTTDSPEAYEHYVAGLLALDEAQTQAAVRELERATEIDSTFALALFELGRAYRTWFSELSRSRDVTDRAWRHRSRLGVKDRMRLEAWRQQRDSQVTDAMETYREMRGRWPDDRDVLSDLAAVLTWYWYVDECLEVAEQGHRLYPDDSSFASNYVASLRHVGRAEEAHEVARHIVDQYPERASAWDDLGMAHLGVGQSDDAEEAFRKALQIEPGSLWPRQGLVECRYRRGDVEGAIEEIEGILRDPELLDARRVSLLHYHAWTNLALLHMEAGRFQKALETVEKARRFSSGPESEFEQDKARARVWLRMGRSEQVIRWAQDLAARTPARRADAHFYLAPAWVQLDSLEQAENAAAAILALEPERGAVASAGHLTAARIALAESDPEAALRHLDEHKRRGLLAGGFHQIDHWTLRARAHRMAGRFDEAVATLEHLLRIYGGHALGHYELGQVYEDMDRSADAQREYSVFLKAWSDADEGLRQVADAERRLAVLRQGVN